MANNRLIVRCKCCGGMAWIATHVIGPWHTNQTDIGEYLNKFFNKHAFCEDKKSPFYNEKFECSNMFELTTENTINDYFYDKETGNEYCTCDETGHDDDDEYRWW